MDFVMHVRNEIIALLPNCRSLALISAGRKLLRGWDVLWSRMRALADHMADVLVSKGYAVDMRDAFDRYLAEGKPGFVSVPRVAPEDACQWIREAGEPQSLHPGLYGDDELVRRIIEQSRPDGIEVFHSDHGPKEEHRYAALAHEFNLIVTGGSDYHGVRQGLFSRRSGEQDGNIGCA